MPATAGRVRMPANNRVHSSAALQTHGIWQSAIGYDPYAPTAKEEPKTTQQKSDDPENSYASFQGLLALARITGSNNDEARGSWRRLGGAWGEVSESEEEEEDGRSKRRKERRGRKRDDDDSDESYDEDRRSVKRKSRKEKRRRRSRRNRSDDSDSSEDDASGRRQKRRNKVAASSDSDVSGYDEDSRVGRGSSKR
ncbi:unnamed protein product [Brassica rapa subsp. trilocularis]